LKDVNIDIKKGEVISIIGPSAREKQVSALPETARASSGGRIWINGLDILDPKNDPDALRRKMGWSSRISTCSSTSRSWTT
jgi:ABC-type phosphate transport system ATPase subunit